MERSKLSTESSAHRVDTTLNWKIKNFRKLYETAKKEKKIGFSYEKFTVGKDILSSSRDWGFHFERNDENDTVGVFLNFYGSGCCSAEYDILLKSQNGEFPITYRTPLRKYAPQGANIEDATDNWGWPNWKSMFNLQNEGFLSNGELNLKIKMTVYPSSSEISTTKNVLKDLKNGLDSGVGSDVTFVFVKEGSENVIEKIKAHKAVLSLRSPVFAKMFGSGKKNEATGDEVPISDMTPKAMRFLLQFMYSGKVDSGWESLVEELIYGANKYDLDELKKFLCENISSALTVENAWKLRNLAKLYKLPQVLKATMKFISENGEDFFEKHDVVFKDDSQ